MNTYEIVNRTSGHSFGFYAGDSPQDAIEALSRDAGYNSVADAARANGVSVDQLRAELTAIEVFDTTKSARDA